MRCVGSRRGLARTLPGPMWRQRRLLRPGAIIGKSSHSLDQAKAVLNEGADYVSIGPMFQTGTKDAGPTVGVDLFRQVAAEIELPLCPIGGITAENVDQLEVHSPWPYWMVKTG